MFKFAIDIDVDPKGMLELTYGKSEVDVGYTTVLVFISINSTRSPFFNWDLSTDVSNITPVGFTGSINEEIFTEELVL